MNTQLRKFYELTDEGQGGYPTAAQKEARRIVDMFYMVIHNEFVAIKCAIVHVRGIIEEVRDFGDDNHRYDRMNFMQSILSEIEKM